MEGERVPVAGENSVRCSVLPKVVEEGKGIRRKRLGSLSSRL